MSTRSGKRLHNGSNENVKPELPLKNERKTRSKRFVDNSDSQGVVVKAKKRRNYVSFPSQEDSTGVNSSEDERRSTLREQNDATEAVVTVTSFKTQTRTTRRTKKFSETDEAPDILVNEDQVVIAKQKGKKSKKKSKKVESEVNDKENVKAGKKKKNKKKNSKSNFVEVKSNGRRNIDGNLSTDSFHTAAGSPCSPKHAENTDKVPTHNTSGTRRRSSLKSVSELNTLTKAMDVDDYNIRKESELLVITGKCKKSTLTPIITDKESTLPHTMEKVDLNTTFEKEPTKQGSIQKKRKSNLMLENIDPLLTNSSTYLDIPKTSKILNTTFEKGDTENDVKSKTNKTDNKEEIIEMNTNSSFEIRRSLRQSLNTSEKTSILNGTFGLSPKPDLTKPKSLDTTYEKECKLDSTFDKTDKPSLGSKSSLISSDATNNSIISLDKSDHSKITDDDSKTENILNTTPLLIESSMEESKVLESSLKENKTPESVPPLTVTPLKREGTFTKDSPSKSLEHTPNKRQTLPAAGCTPYHSNGKGSQKRRVLNLTHSIEKPGRRSSMAELPRATRVMFCSPVNNPGVATQRKTKIIKSNLKGSNKSFVFDESETESVQSSRLGRKRSLTHTEGEQAGAGARAKRSRLALAGARARPERSPAPPTVRARSSSAMAKLTNATTPSKPATPAPKSEVKATKLPNFAALHARRFERMESLDECQQRKARRAQHLLVPTGSVAVLERSSPRVTLEPKRRDTPPRPGTGTPAKPASTLPTLESLQRGYTRFGFKMHCDVNPFSVPPNTAEKPKLPNVVKRYGARLNGVQPVASRQVTKPSLVGATSLRRAVAKQTIMREKSFTLAEKRNESRKEVRTVIKGVRTNRRFDLQMKSRNLNG